MSVQPAAPTVKRLAVVAVLFALAVAGGELTFGNPEFPLTVWYFVTIPAWQWSLPVHLTGFVWLVICNRLFIKQPALVAILLSTAFFLTGETLNWYVLDFFAYAGNQTWQKAISFWLVIVMYAGLCTGAVLILRRPGKP